MNLVESYGRTKDRYLELIHEFPLRPIKSGAELKAAIAVLCRLHDQPARDEAEQDYFDVLSEIVERYQNARRKRSELTDAGMLRFLLASRDLTQAKFASDVGIAESTVSEVLAGKRRFTREQIGKVADYFHVLPTVFPFGPE